MDLIERYIYAVTQRIPLDQREDVADELRASIEDALDEKGSHSKKDIKAVLTELGNPTLLAARYKGGSQYLIGPNIYPLYINVLKLTFGIGMPIAFFGALISQILQSPQGIFSFIFAFVWILIAAAFHMLFWVTLVFFIFERTNVSVKDLTAGDTWTPDMLPQIKADRQIPASEAISDIVWYSLLVLLPFLAQPLVGAHIDGQTTPFFNQNIAIVWSVVAIGFGLVGILKSLLKLRLKNWTPALAAFNGIFALAISATLVALPIMTELVNPAFITLLDTHIDTSNLAQVTQGVTWTIWISIAVIVSIYLYDAFNSVRLCRKMVK